MSDIKIRAWPIHGRGEALWSLKQAFDAGLWSDPVELPDAKTRARNIVAFAFREQAKDEDRPMASRLRQAASKLEMGLHPGKRVLDKIGNRRLDDIFTIFERKFKEKMNAQKAP